MSSLISSGDAMHVSTVKPMGYVILSVWAATSALGQNNAERSLTGLRRVGIHIQLSDRMARVTGLDGVSLRNRVSALLAKERITALSREEVEREPGYPVIYVEIVDTPLYPAITPSGPDLAFTSTIFLFQDAALTRSKGTVVSTPTWSTKPIIRLMWRRSGSAIKAAVIEDIGLNVKVFVEGHRNANRKR